MTVGALHRHASDGTGPRYVMILGRASYRADDLDAWVDQLAKSADEAAAAASLTGGAGTDAEPAPAKA